MEIPERRAALHATAGLVVALAASCGGSRASERGATTVEFVGDTTRASGSTREPGARAVVQVVDDPDYQAADVVALDATEWTPSAAVLGGAVDVAAARAAYQLGVQAYDRGDFVSASSAFANAYRAAPRPQTLYNLARAYQSAGRVGNALAVIVLVRRQGAAGALGMGADTLDLLEAQARQAAATLRVVASGLGDARATIDGTAVAAGVPVALDPGRHTVRIEQRGRVAHERAVDLAAGARVLVRVGRGS